MQTEPSTTDTPAHLAPRSEDALVPVRNANPRILGLSYRLLDDEEQDSGARVGRYRLLPGLNYVPLWVLKRSGVSSHGLPTEGIEIGDPSQMAPSHAAALAHSTSDRRALRRWLGDEQRTDVRAAIERSLQGKRPADPDDEYPEE